MGQRGNHESVSCPSAETLMHFRQRCIDCSVITHCRLCHVRYRFNAISLSFFIYYIEVLYDEQFQIADHGRRSRAETQRCAGGRFCVLQSGDRHRIHDHQSCGIRCGGTYCLQTLRPPLLRYSHRVSNQPYRAARRGGTFRFRFALTGSAGMGIAQRLQLPFVQEVIAAATAVKKLIPQTDTMVELGAKTPRSCTSAARRKNA